MKTLLKIVIGTVVLVVFLVGAGLAWFHAKGADSMLSKITAAARANGYEMTVQENSLGLFPPRWIWKNFSLVSHDLSLSLNQKSLSVSTKWNIKGIWSEVPLTQIVLFLEQPQLNLHLKEEAPAPTPSTPGEPMAVPIFVPPVDVGVYLSLQNGKMTWTQPGGETSTMDQFHMSLQVPSIKRALVHAGSAQNDQADLTGRVQMNLPLLGPMVSDFEAGLAKDMVIVPRAQVNVMGVKAQARGQMNYVSGEQSWSVRADAQDFSAISGMDLPAQFQSGQLRLALDAQRNKAYSWKANLEFIAKDLKGKTAYKANDLSTEGDFQVQAAVRAQYESEKITIPPFQLNADFSGMGIRYGDLFEKPKGTPGKMALKGSHQNGRIQIETFLIQVGEASVQAAGAISSVPENPQLHLTVSVPNTEAKSLKALVPMLRDYPYTGSFTAQVNLQGPALSSEKLSIQLNPLKFSNISGGINFRSEDGKATAKGNFSAHGEVTARTLFKDLQSAQGQLTADLSGLELKWEQLAGKPKGVPFKVTLKGQMGALPKNQNYLSAVSGQYQMSLGQLDYDGLKFTGITTQGNLKGGQIQGAAKIQSAFGGIVEVKSYAVSMLTDPMKVQSEISTQGVDVQKLTEWFSPEWKESVGGKLQSTVKLQTVFPLPEEVSVMKAVNASGQFKITQFFLKSGQINQMIHKKIEAIPGLGQKVNLKEQTVHATVDGKFSLAKGIMNLPTLRMVTEQNDDIQLDGQILADERLKLKGVAHLNNPPVRGTVLAANSDKEGRLVVPLAVEGTITDPSPQILDVTVKTLLENTVKYEVKQQSKKAESKVKETLEKEAKKLLDGLFK